MRFDKLTTKFQQALADAQSLALGNDNGFIEPQHMLAALLAQEDGGTSSLLARAGVAVPRLSAALKAAIGRLPKVEGTGGEIGVSRDLNNLFNLTDKEATRRGDQFIASELFLLALAGDKSDTGRLAREHGLDRKALEAAIDTVRGGAGVDTQEAEGQREEIALTLSHAKDYMAIILWGLLPFVAVQCFSSTLRNMGETVSPMVASVIAILVNLCLNYVLIFGHFGFPKMLHIHRDF